MTYDIIGTIYEPTGVMLVDEDSNEYPEMVKVDGYFVAVINIKKEIDENGNSTTNRVVPYIVKLDIKPRKFACEDETIYLKFVDREEWLSLGIEKIEGSDIHYKESSIEIPKEVTMRQARLALLQSNLLQTITDAIANGTDEVMKIEWEYAISIERDWDSLITLSEALGMTSQEVDDLFLLASTL